MELSMPRKDGYDSCQWPNLNFSLFKSYNSDSMNASWLYLLPGGAAFKIAIFVHDKKIGSTTLLILGSIFVLASTASRLGANIELSSQN
jgi:hypothetical protein